MKTKDLILENVYDRRIYLLAPNNQRWRIDWFGAVTYAERYQRESQPLIEVQISEVPGDVNPNDLFCLKNDQWPTTRTVRLPVGFLPLLRIGDIWHDGRRIDSPDYDIARFGGLWISRNEKIPIKAGLSDDEENAFYLPISHHPYHVRHTHSYCVLIKTDTHKIVVPSVELIRFYFGSSSNLMSRIFNVPFSPENLWVGVEPGDTGGTPKIHLSPGISGLSASDIGRIAFSAEARSAVELIGDSCITATANGEQAYPKGIFPFEGITDLVASGKWLPFGAQERGVFLVFKLISCTYPFPFSSLRYTSERKTTSNTNTQFGGPDKNSADSHQKRFSKARQDSKLLVGEEPDRAKKTRGLGLFAETGAQFPDLVRKPVSKVEIDHVPTILHSLKGISLISGSSVGDAGKDARIQPIDLVAAENGNIARMKESNAANTLTTAVFLQLTEKLLESGRFTSVEIVRLDPRQRFDHLSMMPMIVDDDGEVLPACVVQHSQNSKKVSTKTRHRRISIGRALDLYVTHYFMIPEFLNTDQQSTDQIELHLISDRSRSIVTHDDLQAAIGTHFSRNVETESSTELATGINSIFFNEPSIDNANDIASILSKKIHRKIFPHLPSSS